MKITPNAAQTVRPADAARVTGSQAAVGSSTAPAAAPRGEAKDSVQISDAGRAVSATGAGLTPERMAEIRGRIQEGAYNSLAVVDEVARRILETGDV